MRHRPRGRSARGYDRALSPADGGMRGALAGTYAAVLVRDRERKWRRPRGRPARRFRCPTCPLFGPSRFFASLRTPQDVKPCTRQQACAHGRTPPDKTASSSSGEAVAAPPALPEIAPVATRTLREGRREECKRGFQRGDRLDSPAHAYPACHPRFADRRMTGSMNTCFDEQARTVAQSLDAPVVSQSETDTLSRKSG